MSNFKRFMFFVIAMAVSMGLTLMLASCSVGENVSNSVSGTVKQVDAATALSVQQDVQNALLTVNTALAANSQVKLTSVPLTVGTPDTTVTVKGDINHYTITGVHNRTGFVYSYDSATGLFQ